MLVFISSEKNCYIGNGLRLRDSKGIRELSVDTTNKKEAVKRFRDYYGLKGKHIDNSITPKKQCQP